jgi:hypothetical protein
VTAAHHTELCGEIRPIAIAVIRRGDDCSGLKRGTWRSRNILSAARWRHRFSRGGARSPSRVGCEKNSAPTFLKPHYLGALENIFTSSYRAKLAPKRREVVAA